MITVEVTVKNKKRRHIRAYYYDEDLDYLEKQYIYNTYVLNDELEDLLVKWIEEYKDGIVTNDIQIIKILRERGYLLYDID
jgi:rRNA-processing protein FCF1